MAQLPETDETLFLRTDFSDDAAWEALCHVVRQPTEHYGFQANVTCLSDARNAGLRVEQISARLAPDTDHTFLFLADELTFSHPERPILVVDLFEGSPQTMRVIPAEVWAVENNLSLGNMDFEEFAGAVDDDGIFRGFEEG